MQFNLTGKVFGRLRALSYAGLKKWSCICACGKQAVVRGAYLRNGHTRSCGCLQRDLISQRSKVANRKHGRARSPVYRSYHAMVQRCTNPKFTYFKNYGGRGIKICRRWMGREGFINFLQDMGVRPADRTLDRIDNDGNYKPTNCHWADKVTQMRNRRK